MQVCAPSNCGLRQAYKCCSKNRSAAGRLSGAATSTTGFATGTFRSAAVRLSFSISSLMLSNTQAFCRALSFPSVQSVTYTSRHAGSMAAITARSCFVKPAKVSNTTVLSCIQSVSVIAHSSSVSKSVSSEKRSCTSALYNAVICESSVSFCFKTPFGRDFPAVSNASALTAHCFKSVEKVTRLRKSGVRDLYFL